MRSYGFPRNIDLGSFDEEDMIDDLNPSEKILHRKGESNNGSHNGKDSDKRLANRRDKRLERIKGKHQMEE